MSQVLAAPCTWAAHPALPPPFARRLAAPCPALTLLIRCSLSIAFLQLDFVKASSYGSGTVSSGDVLLSVDMTGSADVAGRHVLLVSSSCLSLPGVPGPSLQLPQTLVSRAQSNCSHCCIAPHTPACCTACALRALPTPWATHACDPAPHTKRARPTHGPAPPPLPDNPSVGLGAGWRPGLGADRGGFLWRVSSASVAQSERGRA